MSSDDLKENNEEAKDALRPHEFDGIQEYENQLPRWWVGMFYVSILFAFFYMVYFEFEGSGKSLYESYRIEREREIEKHRQKELQVKTLTEDELKVLSEKAEVLRVGAAQFKAKCVSCHADDGGGSVGPNLTDKYWIHGAKMTDFVKVISDGVPAKGMPTWRSMMSADEIHSVVVYIQSLRGSKPKNPKKPEGDILAAP